MNQPKPIHSNLLMNGTSDPSDKGEIVSHGFFTRHGGYSTGIYQGLNAGLGSNDDRHTVIRNRQAVADCLSILPKNLLTPFQVHSCDVVLIDKPWTDNKRPHADALVTNTPGVAIGISTADCGPVLFCDRQNGVIGAAHAGWKGAIGGVLENTVIEMEKLGAARKTILAALGPTISARQYEVGPEFVERFCKSNPQNKSYFTISPNPGHAMFDLPAYTLYRLQECGIQAEWTGDCTYEDETSFYSYRRTTHRGEPDYGRQISAITLITRTGG